MSKWTYQAGVDAAAGKHFIYDADGEMTSGEWIGEACDEGTARQIVREHNAHDDLMSLACKYRANRIDMRSMCPCGDNAWSDLRKVYQSEIDRIDSVLACALSAQARAAIEAAEGSE